MNSSSIFKIKPVSEEVMSFSSFLEKLKLKVQNVFGDKNINDQLSLQREIPASALQEIMSGNPLSVSIPVEYGGRGVHMHENLALLSMVSYESLALSLTFGINTALFLQPVAKYAAPEVKKMVFRRFLEDKTMGGLMITEPGFGSDALNMQTFFTAHENRFHIKGKKHWAGLSGLADFWLLTARRRSEKGDLQRDIDFFICNTHDPQQRIVVEEYFNNLLFSAMGHPENFSR